MKGSIIFQRPTQAQEQAFKRHFDLTLMRFMHPLFGFEIVEFERALGYANVEEGSLEDHIREDYGEEAVVLVWELWQVRVYARC
jgi:hypothetical protein